MAALTTDQILEAIASMTVMEASELVKAMEEKFGVTAAAPVVVAGAAAPGAAPAEEKTEFNVTLKSVDASKKIAVSARRPIHIDAVTGRSHLVLVAGIEPARGIPTGF